MDVTQDNAAMLPPGDFEKLDKPQREAFQQMQERMVQFLLQQSNAFQSQFPGLRVEWRFQADAYQTLLASPAPIRYSGRVY